MGHDPESGVFSRSDRRTRRRTGTVYAIEADRLDRPASRRDLTARYGPPKRPKFGSRSGSGHVIGKAVARAPRRPSIQGTTTSIGSVGLLFR